MVQCRLHDEPTLRLEDFLNVLVRNLDVLADKVGDLLREPAGVIDGTWRHLVVADDAVRDGRLAWVGEALNYRLRDAVEEAKVCGGGR